MLCDIFLTMQSAMVDNAELRGFVSQDSGLYPLYRGMRGRARDD